VVPLPLAMSPNPETELGGLRSLATRSLNQGRLRCISLAYAAARSISLHHSLHNSSDWKNGRKLCWS